MAKTKADAKTLKKALMRTNTHALMTGVMLFQFTSMLLLTFRIEPFDLQALVLAIAMPLVTRLTIALFSKLWPIDRATLIMVLFLNSVGIVTLQAIARAAITPRTQAIYSLAGIAAMGMGVAFVRWLPRHRKLLPWFALLCFIALLSPFLPVIGVYKGGARNWVSLEALHIPISGQPSEFIKPALIIILAHGLADLPALKKSLVPAIYAAICCGILLVQKDLGALLLYFITTVCMFYVATGNLPLTLGALGAGCVGAVVAYRFIPLIGDRVALWLNPWSDPTGLGYQLIQSLIAIGSGGLFGMGLGLGSPRDIPLYHSDFIFGSMTEQFGLMFSLMVMAVYVLIIMRGLSMAMNARTSFLSLIAFGIVTMLGFQTMLIIGGNTQILPLTGVVLPLIAAGGSSIVSTYLSFGILLGISSVNAEDELRDLKRMEWREEMEG